MSLKKECKAAVSSVSKSNGIPMITDKSFNTMWETYAKSQPSMTSLAGATFSGDGLSGIPPPPVWDTLEFNLIKYGIASDKKFATKILTILKKKFGESPTQSEIGAFMSG